MVHAIGYLASALLAMSLIVSNAIKFRWLNLGGTITFIIYGVFIDAFPVILANSILLCINIFQTVKLYTAKEVFEMIEVSPTDEFVTKFLKFYKDDIQNFFPDFNFEKIANDKLLRFVVLRNLSIANIFVARVDDDGNAIVEINYTVPKYRDYKVGRFIFEKENEFLVAHKVKRIMYEKVYNKEHVNFLKVMRFVVIVKDYKEHYVKEIN